MVRDPDHCLPAILHRRVMRLREDKQMCKCDCIWDMVVIDSSAKLFEAAWNGCIRVPFFVGATESPVLREGSKVAFPWVHNVQPRGSMSLRSKSVLLPLAVDLVSSSGILYVSSKSPNTNETRVLAVYSLFFSPRN